MQDAVLPSLRRLLSTVNDLSGPLFVLSGLALAGNTAPPRISKQTREEVIHVFNEQLVYIRANFPMGKTGLKLKNGTVTPSGPDLQHLIALWGPAAKPGDRARISDVTIKDDHIRFEINGGPVKKQKWYQHIQIQGTATVTPGGSDSSANARGSFVDLYFDKYVPELTGPELKELLRPVFDFDAKSPLEAYLETVPPQVKDAIKNHHVLVGMNREMVIYAKGRPPKKVREHEGGVQNEGQNDVEYEEWIYGTPPEDVDFVRFVGDEVVRVETMKVDGAENRARRKGSGSGLAHRCQETGRTPRERAYAAASRRTDAGVESCQPFQHAADGPGAAAIRTRLGAGPQLEVFARPGDGMNWKASVDPSVRLASRKSRRSVSCH